MNRTKIAYIGVDISKDTFNFHYSGKDGKCKNSRQGWQIFAKDIPRNSTIGMEATGVYHVNFARYLHCKGFNVLVFNPLRVKRHMQSLGIKAKTDKSDARIISGYAKTDKAKFCKFEPMCPKLARARAIVTILASLQKIQSRARNVNHAIGIIAGAKDKNLLNPMCNISDVCDDQEEILKKELSGIAKELYPEQYRLLNTITGIGVKTSSVLLVLTRGLSFDSSSRLSSFCGLAPDVRESGTSVRGNGHIVKVGCPYLRGLLFMCAGTSVMHNPLCKDLYNRLKAKNKHTYSALTAVMHRLVKICFGVVKSGEPFRGCNRNYNAIGHNVVSVVGS